VAAWLRVLAMPRSWTARATASNGVSGPAGAAAAAWSRILSMPRSVTFTVNIVTKKTGNSEGGPPIPVPHLASGGMARRGLSGLVRGPGGTTADRIPAMLSRNEWVIRAAAVKSLGTDFLSWINSAGSGGLKSPTKGGGSIGGKGFAMAGAGGGGGGDTHVHFHGKVYAKTEQEFEDMVARATKELKRKGRDR
jgi:hypothetical protein